MKKVTLFLAVLFLLYSRHDLCYAEVGESAIDLNWNLTYIVESFNWVPESLWLDAAKELIRQYPTTAIWYENYYFQDLWRENYNPVQFIPFWAALKDLDDDGIPELTLDVGTCHTMFMVDEPRGVQKEWECYTEIFKLFNGKYESIGKIEKARVFLKSDVGIIAMQWPYDTDSAQIPTVYSFELIGREIVLKDYTDNFVDDKEKNIPINDINPYRPIGALVLCEPIGRDIKKAKDESRVRIILNGKQLDQGEKNIYEDFRTLTPARNLSEALGCEISWDEAQKRVTISKDETNLMFDAESDTAILNGEAVSIDAPARIVDGSLVVPVRFLAESFGVRVLWEPDNMFILLFTPDQAESIEYVPVS